MPDDWRIRVELPQAEHAGSLLQRLGGGLGREARELAKELERDRLAVSREGRTLFVYAQTHAQAVRAREIVEAELRRHELDAAIGTVERWLPADDRWDSEAPGPDVDEELVSRGIAPWEVRVECETHRAAESLADRLEGDGYGVLRRWRFVLVGAASREEADALAAQLHGDVEPSSEVVWEVLPGNPFAVFGGLAG